jgi:hypothetical protein
MRHGGWRIDFEDFVVTHTDPDGLPAIKAVAVDTDFSAGKEPAHGQHFDPSLSVPFLLPVDRDTMMGRHVRKWRP